MDMCGLKRGCTFIGDSKYSYSFECTTVCRAAPSVPKSNKVSHQTSSEKTNNKTNIPNASNAILQVIQIHSEIIVIHHTQFGLRAKINDGHSHEVHLHRQVWVAVLEVLRVPPAIEVEVILVAGHRGSVVSHGGVEVERAPRTNDLWGAGQPYGARGQETGTYISVYSQIATWDERVDVSAGIIGFVCHSQ